MHKKKIAAVTMAMILSNYSAGTMQVLANEVSNNLQLEKSNEEEASKAVVSKFDLHNSDKLDDYNKEFKIDNSKIKYISNNGGNYGSYTIDKAIDEDFSTFWETGKENSADFTSEVVITFNEITNINRIVYAARQDSAKGKGFAQNFEIYASLTEDQDDFRLVSSGEYSGSAGDIVEIQFKATEFKRLKFKFTKANQNWASASEFMFYKEDSLRDSMKELFTDSTMSQVSEEFNSADKINDLEEKVKNHTLYESFKEDIENAKALVNKKEVVYTDAKVSHFKDINSELLPAYDEIYKLSSDKIKGISNNGGRYQSETIEKAIDGDVNTKWHSGKQNTSSFTNEVVIELNETTTLNRIVYTSPRGTHRGFAQKFEIYVSTTSKGDTFELVSSGSAKETQNSVEIRFNPTEFKRVKFVFKQGYEDWACAAEFGLYTQDETAEKIERLFVDSNMSQVSEEFNTLDKIDDLEEEAKNHPFYEDYKEDIENAKSLVKNSKVTYMDTVVSQFISDEETKKAYDAKYKLSSDKIKGITTNGSHYGDNVISHAIDGNLNTNWHSDKQNTSTFKNEFIIELKELEELNRITYTAPRGTHRGFPEEFEIYASVTTKGDNFELVSKGATQATQNELEFKFNSTKFRRIKFVYAQGYEDWACAAEIGLYKEDKISDKVNSVFTDGTRSKLSEEYNTIDKITVLEKEVKGHILEKEHMEVINLAKEIINNPGKIESTVIELESRGNSIKESQKRKMWNFQDWQPTGLAVKSGQVITVYVDLEKGKPTPQLVFKQIDSQHNGNRVINLTNGKNVITIPEVDSNELRPGTAKAGVLYTSNPYTPEEQGRMPKIRIEGAFSYPHYIKGVDNDEEVMQELSEYVEMLEEDSTLPDVFEVFSDKTLVNVRATYALDWYTKNNKLPSYTANKSDEVIRETMRFWGYDGSTELNSDFNFRYVTMLKWLDNGGFMNAGNGITGFNQGSQGGVLNVDTGWGLMHEMGHNFDTGNRTIGEVTNNILPLHFQRINGLKSKISEQNLWESKILPKVAKEDYSNNELYPENDKSLLTHLAPLWQLQLYDETFWPRFEQEFRARNIGGGSWDNIHNAWVMVASDVLQLDLVEHFARHGLYVNEETKEYTSKYEKSTKKLWYMNDNKYLNTDSEFNENLEYSVTSKLSDTNVKLTFEIDKVNANSLLGYEILRDGEIISFTASNSFTDSEITSGANHEYTVIAYDNNLNASEPYKLKIQDPVIKVDENATIALNSEFDLLDFVTARDYKGNLINDCVEVRSSNVDVTKKGTYEVEYTLTYEGVTKTAKGNVEVVSEIDYLSDMEWEAVETEYGTPRRNTNIQGRVNQIVKTFEKGFGIHANGKITYDLSDKDYDRFEALVGVDSSIAENNHSSITFKISGDGKTLATTNVIRYTDDLLYINVPVKGVNELVIEVYDGGNGNTCDHGIIANPKLITNNAKPKINASNQLLKIGEKLNLMEGVTAKDAEDGDITSKVKVSGKVNFNKPGKYTITYTVTDNDGNKAEETRTIVVVNMDDYKYLTEYNWKSAHASWGTVKKDKSIDGNSLRLTGENSEEIVYEKGIGTHATSTIIYDLSDKDYAYFTSYVGVDREMYNSVGSVVFKVYVDGELKFDSGLMNSTDGQKYVEVDINGAKELKLVVTDGGNGIGSDHASWADTKLHFVNDEETNYEELESLVSRANEYNKDLYTEESFNVFEEALNKAIVILEDKISSQREIYSMIEELNVAIENPEENIDLNEVVNINDRYLKSSIKKELNLTSDTITVGDMQNLTALTVHGAESLEGLQYAKNLKSLNIEYNEIRDLSPLKNLKKLTDLRATNQIISAGMLTKENNKIAIDYNVIDSKGEKLLPTSITVRNNKTLEDVTLDINECIDKDGIIYFDTKGFDTCVYTVYLGYENLKDNYTSQVIFMFNNR